MLTASAISASGIAASRKRVPSFQLFRPRSIEATCALLAEWPGAVLHAGGIDLVSRMKCGRSAPAVIALGDVAELKGVRLIGDVLEIGAATSHWQIEHDELLKSCLPCMADYLTGLGNVRVRMQGTIGGNVMAAEPGYEMLAFLAALDARLHFAARSDRRLYAVTARDFLPDSRAECDLLTAISIPLPTAKVAWNRDLRPALGVVASLELNGDAVRSAYGATTGQGPIGNPIEFVAPISRHAMALRAHALAESWAASLPLVETPAGLERDYACHVLGVLMRRLLERMTEEPR
jgi:aerobic carbon-monoxide dehydrogenase medium subunit